jgi:hypothetical protein
MNGNLCIDIVLISFYFKIDIKFNLKRANEIKKDLNEWSQD